MLPVATRRNRSSRATQTLPLQLPLHPQYGPDTAKEGKAAAAAELRRRMGLAAVDVPIVGVVTRLVHQKGIHLIKHAAWRTLERGGQFVLLGSAPDPRVQVRVCVCGCGVSETHLRLPSIGGECRARWKP